MQKQQTKTKNSDLLIPSWSFDISALKNSAIDLHKEKASRRSKSISVRSDDSESVMLDVNAWLPAAAEHYNISADIRDYVLHPTIVNISGLPNTNGDSFSAKEWLSFKPKFGMLAYKTFKGKSTFIEHCFPAKTLITTKKGYKHISKIKVGDEVLTHTGAYKKVTQLFNNGVKPVSEICVQGYGTFQVTSNHPMYVVDKRQVFGLYDPESQSRRPKLRRKDFSDIQPHFRPVTDVYTGDYLVMPIYVGGSVSVDPDLAFLTGLFAAEGCYEKYKGERYLSTFCLGYHETDLIDRVEECLTNLGYDYSLYPNKRRSVFIIAVRGRAFAKLMYEAVGEYSHRIHLKSVRRWDVESLKWFLGGYISGDGSVDCVHKRSGRVRSVTVSQALAIDIQNVWARLGVPATITRKDKTRTVQTSYTTVSGEVRNYEYVSRGTMHVGVSPRDAEFLNPYMVGKFIKAKADYGRASLARNVIAGDFLLLPIRTVQHSVDKVPVYNFEVEEDHTYVAGGFIAHNCNQDYRKSAGVMFDASLSRLIGFDGNRAKLKLLLAFDRNLNPDLCEAILDGTHNTYSMGVYYTSYTCSICGNTFSGSSRTFCSHTRINKPVYRMGDKLAYRICHNLEGFETSAVRDPAFICAASLPEHVLDPRSI